MHADSAAVLWDALHAGRLVQRFVGGSTFDAYDSDDLMRSAVERQLGIVGEALNKLARVDPVMASAIAELPRLVGFRNVLVHGYATVDNRLVWRIVEDHLPALLDRLEELLPSEHER
jgi:uncharacterized protein with HEPN domain